MLGVRKYSREYVDGCRSRVESALVAYRKLVDATAGGPGAGNAALADLEASYFGNMVLLLDYMFVHRLRGVEGKDGNPLNEVRVLANSMLEVNGVMTADKTIALSAQKSVLGYEVGDVIRLAEGDFTRLSAAFFAEIERKFL